MTGKRGQLSTGINKSMLHAVMLDLGNGDFVNELHQVLGDSKFASYFESALTNSDDNKTLFD
ncbi:MAG: hypothetical protein WAM24_07130 [Ignavibacteriaceae bacterium]